MQSPMLCFSKKHAFNYPLNVSTQGAGNAILGATLVDLEMHLGATTQEMASVFTWRFEFQLFEKPIPSLNCTV